MSGAATTSGTTFQEEVATWFACAILADDRAPDIADLPSQTKFERVICEADRAVDDVVVGTSQEGFVSVQAKTTLSFSADDSQLASVIGQFVGQLTRIDASNSRSIAASISFSGCALESPRTSKK